MNGAVVVQILLSIAVSLMASAIFWLVTDFIPTRRRYGKVRPKVEFDLYGIERSLFAYLRTALKINEYDWYFPAYKIESGTATVEDFRLWLQNKCLNSTFQFDEMGPRLLPVGQDLEDRALELCRAIEQTSTFYAFMTAEEILLLRKVADRLRTYSYVGNASDRVGSVVLRPANPTISYMAENFSELNYLYFSLKRIVLGFRHADELSNKYGKTNRVIERARVEYLRGNYRKCLSIIRPRPHEDAFSSHVLRYKALYCLGKREEAAGELGLALDSTSLKPVSIRNLFYDARLDYRTMDREILSVLDDRYSVEDIQEMFNAIEQERTVVDSAMASAQEIMRFYAGR